VVEKQLFRDCTCSL